MSVVLDTSVLVDHLRASPEASRYLVDLEDRPACSEISRIEVLQGLRSAERRSVEQLFSLVRWVAVDDAIARRAGELGRRWRQSHSGIGVADLAIAATAEHLEAGLATRNVKHFPMFDGLQPPY